MDGLTPLEQATITETRKAIISEMRQRGMGKQQAKMFAYDTVREAVHNLKAEN